jgi:orotate phosphoribosyltransferase
LLREIAALAAPRIPAGTEGLAGLELGGVPIATALSLLTGLPAYFVRKEAKKYGTERLVEGGDVEGRRLLVVEDVVTSGGQVVLSADDLRAAGAVVTDALCVIDRESGAANHLGASGIALHALFTSSDLAGASTGISSP